MHSRHKLIDPSPVLLSKTITSFMGDPSIIISRIRVCRSFWVKKVGLFVQKQLATKKILN